MAHYIIIGTSLFSIFWGAINVLLVSTAHQQLHFGIDQRNQHERLTAHREGA